MVSTRRCHMTHYSSEYGFIARDTSWPRNFSSWRYQPRSYDMIPLDFFGATRKAVFVQINIEHLKTNIRQVMAEVLPNMCQKNQCLQHSAWRSFKWCCISHIISIKKEISWKKILYTYITYVYFWNHEMDNPTYVQHMYR